MDTAAVLELMKETAAEVINPRFRALAETDVETKTHASDFVTIADKEAEVMLTERLRSANPDAVVVGEEAIFAEPNLREKLNNADHAFIIDPIDGTANFVRGKDEHGIIIAETRGGVTTRGWIWQPQTGRAYVAERGAGVRMNDAPIVPDKPERLPLGATSKDALQGYDGGGKLSPTVHTKFACCFDYPAALHGEYDFIYYTSLMPWDHLAGALMLTENGGISRTMDGLAYTVLSRSKGLLVANDVLVWMTAQQNWKP